MRFARPGLELNLGSIGKGWALDRVAAGLRSACGRARARLGRRQQPARVGRAAVGGSPHVRRRDARDAAPARRRDRHERRCRAARRGRGPALRPRHRPAHRLARGGRAQRDRDRRRGGRRRRARHGVPRRRGSGGPRDLRGAPGHDGGPRARARAGRPRRVGERDGVGIEPAAGLSLRDEPRAGPRGSLSAAHRDADRPPQRGLADVQSPAALPLEEVAHDVERHRGHRRRQRDREDPGPDDAARRPPT